MLGRVFATAIKRVPSWSVLIILSLGVVALWAFQLFAAAANEWVDCHLLPHYLGYIFVAVQFTYYSVRGSVTLHCVFFILYCVLSARKSLVVMYQC